MRMLMIAALGATALTATVMTQTAAEAQRVVREAGTSHIAPGARPLPPRPPRSTVQRWPMREGRWMAGDNAPGGWNAYRRPYAGWALPVYWTQAGFVVDDWAGYGLAPPPRGYRWIRYYDDAVLIDDRGSVYEVVDGVAWDEADDGDRAYAHADRAFPPPDGHAIDRTGNHRPPPPPPPYRHAPGGHWTSPDGYTTVTTTGGGYGPTTTTVVVESPVVTTTTTEIFEDAVTYTRPIARKTHKRRWMPRKTLCRCK